MSLHEPVSSRASLTSIDADRAVKFGVGVAAAPLWAAYFTAASAGVAYWWMTAWVRHEPRSYAFARFEPFEPAEETFAPVLTKPEPEPEAVKPEAPTAFVYVEPAAKTVELAPEPAPEPAPAPKSEPEPKVEAAAPEAAPKAIVEAAPVAPPVAAAVVAPEPVAAPAPAEKPAPPAAKSAAVEPAARVEAARKPPVRRKPEPKSS